MTTRFGYFARSAVTRFTLGDMRNSLNQRRGKCALLHFLRFEMLAVAYSGLMIRLFIFTACVVLAQSAAAQSAATAPAFEVASIKPNLLAKQGGEGSRRESTQSSPGSLTMRNVTMRTAIMWAYRVQAYQVTGPGWIGDERY